MPETPTLTVYGLTVFVLLVVPGPAVLFIVNLAVDRGRLAGLTAVLGIAFGTCFHIAAAMLGITALLRSSEIAFSLVKYLGAAYLIYMGLRRWLSTNPVTAADKAAACTLPRLFVDGMIVNLLNPKSALFFVAFLPQFIDPHKGAVWTQFLRLGTIFIAMAVLSDGFYALVAGSVRSLLQRETGSPDWQRWLTGGIYIALGIAASLLEFGSR